MFGSAARGDDEPRVDVDFVVALPPVRHCFDEVRLRLALRDLVQVKVDVVASDGLRGAFSDRVLKRAVRPRQAGSPAESFVLGPDPLLATCRTSLQLASSRRPGAHQV